MKSKRGEVEMIAPETLFFVSKKGKIHAWTERIAEERGEAVRRNAK